MKKKAIVLLSGGLDSAVILALALAQKRECYTLSFDYGQNHRIELKHAEAIAKHYQVSNCVIKVDSMIFSSSSLVSSCKTPPKYDLEDKNTQKIPTTYVPARNTLFLSYALGFCEAHQAHEIHFGANHMDYNAYPDCRPEYVNAFQKVINLATKQSIESHPPQLVTPLISLDKAEIISLGIALKAPLDLTFSCYFPVSDNIPCQTCSACTLRREGFIQAQ